MKLAKQAFLSKDYDKAFELFGKVIQRNSYNHEAFYYRGQIYEHRNMQQLAANDYIKAFETADNKMLSGLAAGRMLYKTKVYEKSLSYLKTAYNIDTTNIETIYYLMMALSANDKPDEALLLFDKIENPEKEWSLIYAKAIASDSLEMPEYARIFYRASIELNDTVINVYTAFVKMLINTENYEAALEIVSYGITKTNSIELFKIRFGILEHQSLWREAIADASTLYNMTNEIYYIEKRAAFFRKLGMHTEVLNDCSFVLSVDSTNCNAWFLRGVTNNILQNTAQTLTDFTIFLNCDTTQLPARQVQFAKEQIKRLIANIPSSTIKIIEPIVYEDKFWGIDSLKDSLLISGYVLENSTTKQLIINGSIVYLEYENSREKKFYKKIPYPKNDTVTIVCKDIFDKIAEKKYTILLIKKENPEIILEYPQTDSLSGVAHIKVRNRFINVKAKYTGKNPLAKVTINKNKVWQADENIETQISLNSSVPLPEENRIIIEVIDVFGQNTTKEYKINLITDKILDENIKKDILFLIFDGMEIEEEKNETIIEQLTSIIEKTSNAEYILSPLEDKKSIEKYLLFEFPQLIAAKKYRDIIVFFTGMGIENIEESYWLPKKSTIYDRLTWQNLAFLSSLSNLLKVEGNLIYMSNSTFLSQNLAPETDNANNQQFIFVKILNVGNNILQKVMNESQINRINVDLLEILKILSISHPGIVDLTLIDDNANAKHNPITVIWK